MGVLPEVPFQSEQPKQAVHPWRSLNRSRARVRICPGR